MVVTLKNVLDSLPSERRREIDQRYEDLVNEVESLKELRLWREQTQADMAAKLGITQPAISKLEKQTDMYLSSLRDYIEAMGGQLDIVVRLPDRGPFKIRSL